MLINLGKLVTVRYGSYKGLTLVSGLLFDLCSSVRYGSYEGLMVEIPILEFSIVMI